MFTGIVETTGNVAEVAQGRLEVELPWTEREIHVGQSLAVDGCCLTVAGVRESRARFDVSPETLSRTILGGKKRGDAVNLERGMKLGDAIDGHIVTGHIDGVGRVRSIEISEAVNRLFWIDIPEEAQRWLVEKGSVAVDGVSLTVNRIDGKGFSVMLIPHTLQITTLGRRSAGDPVNLEFDILGKYVERLLRQQGRPGAAA